MRSKPKRRGKPKLVVVHGDRQLGTDEGQVLLLGATERYHARRLQRRLERAKERLAHSPERQSVAIAMLAVEEQIVKALWTIARQPLGKGAPLRFDADGELMMGRCGLDFIREAERDTHAGYKDSASGDYSSVAPRPALPSSREITVADRAQEWLLLVDDEGLRRILVVGATDKRGDAGRQIRWERVREHLREFDGYTVRSMKSKYQEALRIIASELTIARVG